MALTHTRTYVHYWSEDQLEPLKALAEEIISEGEHRMPHVSEQSRGAMTARIAGLRSAIELMGERVPE